MAHFTTSDTYPSGIPSRGCHPLSSFPGEKIDLPTRTDQTRHESVFILGNYKKPLLRNPLTIR